MAKYPPQTPAPPPELSYLLVFFGVYGRPTLKRTYGIWTSISLTSPSLTPFELLPLVCGAGCCCVWEPAELPSGDLEYLLLGQVVVPFI